MYTVSQTAMQLEKEKNERLKRKALEEKAREAGRCGTSSSKKEKR